MECLIHDTPIYYEEYGSGTPIILIHGFGPDHRLMTGCMEPLFLQRTDWRRIYIDLPGMGRTPGKDSVKNSDDVLNLILDFIDTLIPEQHFLLVGESYGGYLSRGIVLRKFIRVEGMALICPGIIMERSRRDVPPRTIIAPDPQLLASLDADDAEEFGAMSVVQDNNTWERFRDEILSGAHMADGAFLDKISQHYSFSFDVDQLPEPFTKPVLFFTGRQDSSTGYRDAWNILENYPRGTFAVLDRAGHNAHIEQSNLLNALMSEWLDRVLESLH